MNTVEKSLFKDLSLSVGDNLTLDYSFDTYDELVYTVHNPEGVKVYETGNLYCVEALVIGYTAGRGVPIL